uniref:Annexin n=1 Tax=Aegilops tauschii subsp. strangulata TaxID=200361 RepID=A0A453GLM0_AEGTS
RLAGHACARVDHTQHTICARRRRHPSVIPRRESSASPALKPSPRPRTHAAPAARNHRHRQPTPPPITGSRHVEEDGEPERASGAHVPAPRRHRPPQGLQRYARTGTHRIIQACLRFVSSRRSITAGFGCDSTTVINILAHRDAVQRALIMQEYRAIYHQDLYHRLSTELSGNHKKAMLLWVLDPVGRDAAILNQSLNGDITDLRAATEVICSRTPSQLQIMKQTYRARFGCYLEQDITERTYGDHHKLLLAYLGIPRY